MSSDPPPELHPIMVVEDRYSGCYSHGRWWAVAGGDDAFEGVTRITWLMEDGPGADDVSCAAFWSNPPPWIAVAHSPDQAVAKLIDQPGNTTDDWRAPIWEGESPVIRWPERTSSAQSVSE